MEALRSDLVEPGVEELEAEYAAYRRRHARLLVGMMPREAVRPLYRRAARALGVRDAVTSNDPLSMLVAYCESILPLPPFEVWLEDARSHPGAYLADLDDSPQAPTAAAPATIEARRFDRGREEWLARLRGFRDRDAWRGFIAFRRSDSDATYRTALIFREPDPATLRERFIGFETAALEAFLRSSLP